jgi:hypothetical protein
MAQKGVFRIEMVMRDQVPYARPAIVGAVGKQHPNAAPAIAVHIDVRGAFQLNGDKRIVRSLDDEVFAIHVGFGAINEKARSQ